ncbi:MAG: hypothetical protein JXA21_28250 [Anaerolineae bacterium]|nr:hypothetical protein [Anaerolineae bacterium]
MPADLARLVEETYGLPAALIWALGQMACTHCSLETALRRVYDPQADLQVFLFRQLLTRLQTEEPLAIQVLRACSAFAMNAAVDLTDLAARVDLAEDQVRVSCHRLANWHLGQLDAAEQHLTLHPLAYRFVTAHLTHQGGM